MTGIVDYNAGNIKSVERSLDALKAPFISSKRPDELERCDRLVFPGVGDAAYAMRELKAAGFDSFLKEWADAGKPLLGICLGSHIIFDESEEGGVQCLGLLKGRIRRLSALWEEAGIPADGARKTPHMGWNDIKRKNGGSPLLEGIPERADFYFVHSYVICPEDARIVKAAADYGIEIPACVESGAIAAFQFHPEKSGAHGMRILRSFCRDDIRG